MPRWVNLHMHGGIIYFSRLRVIRRHWLLLPLWTCREKCNQTLGVGHLVGAGRAIGLLLCPSTLGGLIPWILRYVYHYRRKLIPQLVLEL